MYSVNFRAVFTDGSSFDQSREDDQPNAPSSFRELVNLQEQGKILAEFHLLAPDFDLSIEMRTGHFLFKGSMDQHDVYWVCGKDDPLPEGLSPKLIYYHDHIPENIPGLQHPPVVRFCIGWEAGGVKNILGVSP